MTSPRSPDRFVEPRNRDRVMSYPGRADRCSTTPQMQHDQSNAGVLFGTLRASRKCTSEGPEMMKASPRGLPPTRKPMRVLRSPETTNTPPTPSPENRLRGMAPRRAHHASTYSAKAGKRRGSITTATCRASRPRNCHPRAARPVSRTRRRPCAAGKWPSVNADPYELSEGRPTSKPSRGTATFSARAIPAA